MGIFQWDSVMYWLYKESVTQFPETCNHLVTTGHEENLYSPTGCKWLLRVTMKLIAVLLTQV